MTTENGIPSVGYTYTYDDFGNRLTMTTDGVTTNYTYDLNNRLLQTTAGETTVTYTYNANDDMITEYKVVENIPEQNTTYTYSIYTGMLTSVSSTVGNVNANYDYYPSGLRLKNGDTYFIYDGQNIVAEYDLANDEYIAVYGYAINRINRITEVEQAQVYIYNAHGDVIGMVSMPGENNTPSVIEKEYDYDAFGNEVFPDPDDENPFRYCGEYYDKGTNRLYLRARDYDASTGRFTSEDDVIYGVFVLHNQQEIIDVLSLNLYTYCNNNPVTYSDSTGNSKWYDLGSGYRYRIDIENGSEHIHIQGPDGKEWKQLSDGSPYEENHKNTNKGDPPRWVKDKLKDNMNKKGKEKSKKGPGWDWDGNKEKYEEELNKNIPTPEIRPIPSYEEKKDIIVPNNNATAIWGICVVGYIAYRILRMIPSVAIPALWPSIPTNLVTP